MLYLMFSRENIFSGTTDRIDTESLCEFIPVDESQMPEEFDTITKEENYLNFYKREGENLILIAQLPIP